MTNKNKLFFYNQRCASAEGVSCLKLVQERKLPPPSANHLENNLFTNLSTKTSYCTVKKCAVAIFLYFFGGVGACLRQKMGILTYYTTPSQYEFYVHVRNASHEPPNKRNTAMYDHTLKRFRKRCTQGFVPVVLLSVCASR